MGAALDTAATWTRAQSAVGNVEINPLFSWVRMQGNNVWGGNGLYTQAPFTRTPGMVYQADVYASSDDYTSRVVVGWNSGTGHSYTDFAHGLLFTNNGGSAAQLYVFENGNNRGAVGAAYTQGYAYRVRITLTAIGATYEIQGGPEYAGIGSTTWTTLNPTSSASPNTALYPGAAVLEVMNDCVHVGDIRVY
jgi:hypothetical protein